MRLYISGPMTGIPNFNRPAFHAAAAYYRGIGYRVENPAENPVPACGGTWKGWMRQAIVQLLTCRVIVLLPGWECSRGARLERWIALRRGIDVWVYVPTTRDVSLAFDYARCDRVAA